MKLFDKDRVGGGGLGGEEGGNLFVTSGKCKLDNVKLLLLLIFPFCSLVMKVEACVKFTPL
jgi:hypothetical protein